MTTETATKERPILFSGPMVRAILDGSKTQTRRVVKPSNSDSLGQGRKITREIWPGYAWDHAEQRDQSLMMVSLVGVDKAPKDIHLSVPWAHENDRNDPVEDWARHRVRPDWDVGGRLKVKEPFRILSFGGGTAEISYDADFKRAIVSDTGMPNRAGRVNERNCPVSARRITLEITDVRVERLQAISEADAVAEGAPVSEAYRGLRYVGHGCWSSDQSRGMRWGPRSCFAGLWDSINAKTHTWSSNPWVWVVTFKRIEAR